MKMKGAELNYPIYDKELMAIIRAFEEWRPELAGTEDPIEVFSDHRTLQWFMTTKQLSRRQARWAEFLSEFNFIIKYRPGKQGTKPDSLTRRTGDIPDGVDDDRIQQQQQQLLKDHMYESPPDDSVAVAVLISDLDGGSRQACHLALVITDTLELDVSDLACWLYALSEEMCCGDSLELLTTALEGEPEDDGDEQMSHWEPVHDGDSDGAREPIAQGNLLDAKGIIERVRAATEEDDILQQIISCKEQGKQRLPYELIKAGLKLDLSNCRHAQGIVYVRDRVYVPEGSLRTQAVALYHETLPGGHGGRHATYEKLARHFFWPFMTATVAQYVRNCLTCQRSKPHKEGKHGLLNPLPIPDRYWNSISIDFITPLPATTFYGRTYQHIMVIVDRFSKKKRFVPLQTLEVEEVVQAFIEHVWREEGFPDEVISDRGAQFTSHFWKRLCDRVGTRPKMSTSHHPETDGQTEVANAALKQFLRAFVHYDQSNWAELLPFAEFQANNTVNTSGFTASYATKGYHPRSGLEPPTPTHVTGWKAVRDTKAADALLKRISDVKEHLTWSLSWAQSKMEEQANRLRSPAPELRPGDLVMLDARNVRTRQHSKGLSPKNLGPFKVLESFQGKAYKLDFSEHEDLRQIYPVFHPWLLHPYDDQPLPGQRQEPQGPVDVDEEGDLYEVEDILDAKVDRRRKDTQTGKKGVLRYLVKWTGWDKPDWLDYTDVTGCSELLTKYHERHPEVEMPPSLRYIGAHTEHLAYLWM
jgi:hypothetical protein